MMDKDHYYGITFVDYFPGILALGSLGIKTLGIVMTLLIEGRTNLILRGPCLAGGGGYLKVGIRIYLCIHLNLLTISVSLVTLIFLLTNYKSRN